MLSPTLNVTQGQPSAALFLFSCYVKNRAAEAALKNFRFLFQMVHQDYITLTAANCEQIVNCKKITKKSIANYNALQYNTIVPSGKGTKNIYISKGSKNYEEGRRKQNGELHSTERRRTLLI